MPIPIDPLARWLRLTFALVTISLSPPPQSVAQVQPDRLERTVTVSVTTEHGEIANGLAPARFRANIRHHPVEILSAEESSTHRVVLMFDTSGSMAAQNHLPLLMFADEFLAETTPGTPLAIMTFASGIEGRTDLSSDPSFLRAELKKLNSTPWDANRPQGAGRTALLDTLDSAVRILEPARPGDCVLVVSDGNDNASHVSWGRVFSLLTRSGVRLFALVPVQALASRARTPEGEPGPWELKEFAEKSGGDIHFYTADQFDWLTPSWLSKHRSDTTANLRPLLAPAQTFAREAGGYYLLRVRLPEPVEKPQNWKLEVVDPQTGEPDHHLVLHYPRQFMPLPEKGA